MFPETVSEPCDRSIPRDKHPSLQKATWKSPVGGILFKGSAAIDAGSRETDLLYFLYDLHGHPIPHSRNS